MPLKVVRNDITKMNTDAIVNTANKEPVASYGCDISVYRAAGYDQLLTYRKEKVGVVEEGEVFLTPGFNLPAKYIIHAVSPRYHNGLLGEEKKLRDCYRKSLKMAAGMGLKSIAFPLIATGSFGYPKEEGMRIAVDEVNAFLMQHDMLVYLVVFGDDLTRLGTRIYPDLKSYVDQNYVEAVCDQEYNPEYHSKEGLERGRMMSMVESDVSKVSRIERPQLLSGASVFGKRKPKRPDYEKEDVCKAQMSDDACMEPLSLDEMGLSKELKERMKHRTDTFSEYMMYLIKMKDLKPADVYKRAIVDKKAFSKIKNNPDAHPKKLTAMCLCVGMGLNLDETIDLLARAGYALSPCDKTDIIFRYFIENEIYDMIELDITLEEYGLPCMIS